VGEKNSNEMQKSVGAPSRQPQDKSNLKKPFKPSDPVTNDLNSSRNSFMSVNDFLIGNSFKLKKNSVAPSPILIPGVDEYVYLAYRELWRRRKARNKEVEACIKRVNSMEWTTVDAKIAKLIKLNNRREDFVEFTPEEKSLWTRHLWLKIKMSVKMKSVIDDVLEDFD
jgi:hypothetical protein